MRYCLLYTLAILFCISCNKNGTPEDEIHIIDVVDDTYPVVELNTPADSQSFISGNVINVTGKVSDNSLYQGSITVRRDDNGSIVKEQNYEIHYIQTYNFSMPCTISVTAATDYTVTVKFEDHGHNQTAKTAKIKVNP